jgi:DNA helicase-2/ATP-dependent DNA helicase PcrA
VYRGRPEAKAILERGVRTLSKCGHTEGFIHPFAGADWLADQNLVDADPQVFEELLAFRPVLQGWHKAVLLPIDQLLLTIAQDLFTEAADLALSDKLAGLLHSSANEHPEWGIAELSDELAEVARNERKFLGFSDEETGFEPDRYRGKVVVATIHKAKGLEWDRVYLTSVNNYDFPSAQSHDQFISEKWFIRDRLNLEAEALSQITGLLQNDLGKLYSPEKTATLEARESYAAERLRLLYVGITRARKELVITWNTGRNGDLQPATPLIAMLEYWKEIVEHA